MRSPTHDLEQFLDELARDARPGDRFPTIRELMRRFGASQMLVQRALESMKLRGLIDSQVGRGTFFRGGGRPTIATARPAGPDAAAPPRTPAVKSILLLRRSISIARGRVLAEGLQRRFAAEGHRVLEVAYTDPDHARTVLKGLPRFDACMVQSTYKTIPIDLLAALKEKSDVLAVDGAALVGADVEAVGTEWGEPLAAAVALLLQRGHQRIAYATTSHTFLATQLGRRRFDHLRASLDGAELQEITVPLLPDEDYAQTLANLIKAGLDSSGRPPFTALVAWGIEDGAKFRGLLSDIGIGIPASLSVVLLGRTDLANEHAGFFSMAGCSVADQIETLHQAINARWADPSAPYGVRFTPVTLREGVSVAAPPRSGPARRPQR
jgi:DNA-binding LacI/PurR family transcriptional regulator